MTGGAKTLALCPGDHQTGRPRRGRGMEVAGRAGVVACRDHLHGRDLQNGVKMTFAKGAALDDLSHSLQRQPGRQYPPCD